MRLLDTRRAAAPCRVPRSSSNLQLRAAILSGCAVVLCGALLLSPYLRVTTVVWTGSVPLTDDLCKNIESKSLGQPLLMLPERLLRSGLEAGERLRIDFERHLPNTLEISVVSRLAVARTADDLVLDVDGNALGALHAQPGLPILSGFEVRGGRAEPAARHVLAALESLYDDPALRPTRVEREGADDVLFHLAASDSRVRMRITALEVQLHKLRLYEQSLGTAPLPAQLDLRFRHQIVVGTAAGGAHAEG